MSDETSCEYCKHKNKFKKREGEDEYRRTVWKCSVGGTLVNTTQGGYGGYPSTLEDAIKDGRNTCGCYFEHYQTGKNEKEEFEWPSKYYGRKVRRFSDGKLVDIEELRRNRDLMDNNN